jgi:type I restriction enzyme S subunit
MSDWQIVKIDDLGKIVTGKTPRTDDSGNYGEDYMFLGPTDLHKHFIIAESEKMISSKGLLSIKGSILDGLSILVGCIGWDMGNVALVKCKCATNQQINSITEIKESYNPFYIYYWLKNKKNHLFKIANVTRTPILNKSDFSNIELSLPLKIQQDKVSSLLSSLDAKIELNNKINTELEAMAKTLYDYWFVQFDFPDANGKPYKTSGGKMVWNEELKREIPEGWEVKTLLDVATFTNGLACQKFRPKENEEFYRVIKIREMGAVFTENSEFVSLSIPEKVVVYNGDILFSWSATLDVKIWTGGTGGLNQHIFKVSSKNYPKSYYYFELLNYLQHFKMMAELRKTTMGHITQDHLRESRITIPPKKLIKELDKILNPILEKKVKLDVENQELSSLRDWLLPMLMNGQVSVGGVVKEYKIEEEVLSRAAEPIEKYS